MSASAGEWIEPLFPDAELPHILCAILRCGACLRKRHATELENHLSDRLRDLLARDPDFRRRPVELFREVPIYDRRASRQKPLGRSDLTFLASTGIRNPWPYFAVEAKRLHVSFPSGWSSLVPKYVTGEQGMMCFVDRRYADGLVCGGMLGYVFDARVKVARAAIAAAIAKHADSLKCAAPGRLVNSSVIPNENRVSETTHLLPGTFTIYHLFLPV